MVRVYHFPKFVFSIIHVNNYITHELGVVRFPIVTNGSIIINPRYFCLSKAVETASCDSWPCYNGGTCFITFGKAYCECWFLDYTGEHCETGKNDKQGL